MGTCSYKESFPEVPSHPTQSLVPNRCSINDRWVSPALSLETGLLPHLSSDPQVTKHIPRTLPAISRFTGNGTGAKAVPSWSQQLGLQRQVTLSMCRKHNATALHSGRPTTVLYEGDGGGRGIEDSSPKKQNLNISGPCLISEAAVSSEKTRE